MGKKDNEDLMARFMFALSEVFILIEKPFIKEELNKVGINIANQEPLAKRTAEAWNALHYKGERQESVGSQKCYICDSDLQMVNDQPACVNFSGKCEFGSETLASTAILNLPLGTKIDVINLPLGTKIDVINAFL